jgi:hypothetical protein
MELNMTTTQKDHALIASMQELRRHVAECEDALAYRLTATAAKDAEIARLKALLNRQMADTQRLVFKDEAEAVCPDVAMCFEYGEHVRCGPCAIKLADRAGVEPNLALPNLPEVSRLNRVAAAKDARISELEAEVARLGGALEQIAGLPNYRCVAADMRKIARTTRKD